MKSVLLLRNAARHDHAIAHQNGMNEYNQTTSKQYYDVDAIVICNSHRIAGAAAAARRRDGEVRVFGLRPRLRPVLLRLAALQLHGRDLGDASQRR